MIKTQVQIPDTLYLEAKRISAEYEMSLAEIMRRGLEKMAEIYPHKRLGKAAWAPPKPRVLGLRSLTHEQLRDLANERDGL